MPTTIGRLVHAALQLAAVTLTLAGAAAEAAPPVDEYTRVMGQASELERAGAHDQAAARLEAIASRYPQDYALHLQLGWSHFQAGHFLPAELSYRHALGLSPTSAEARLGLAWSLLRQGHRAAARRQFQRTLWDVPDNASARKGLSLSQEPPLLRAHPALGGSFNAYQGHPSRSWGLALTASLPLLVRERWLVAAHYRYQRFLMAGEQHAGRRRSSQEGYDQHELYASAGVTRAAFGVVGQYAYLQDGSGFTPRVHLVGLSARYSPWGDLLLSSNVGLYTDMTVVRVTPSWRIPLRPWLLLTPGGALQVATSKAPNAQLDGSTDVLPSGSLSLAVVGRVGSLWVGGKLGDEVRPASLDLPVVCNLPERVRFGAWAGGSLRLGGSWQLRLAYSLERLQARPEGAYSDSNLHVVAVGLAWSSGPGRQPTRR